MDFVTARAMFVPLLVVGILAVANGIYMNFANQARIPRYEAAAQADERAFAESEKERTEAFIKWYPVTMWSMTAFIVDYLGR